jgi:hypothetical protein
VAQRLFLGTSSPLATGAAEAGDSTRTIANGSEYNLYPKEITVHQTVDAILNYIREHLAQRNMAAPILIGEALG